MLIPLGAGAARLTQNARPLLHARNRCLTQRYRFDTRLRSRRELLLTLRAWKFKHDRARLKEVCLLTLRWINTTYSTFRWERLFQPHAWSCSAQGNAPNRLSSQSTGSRV